MVMGLEKSMAFLANRSDLSAAFIVDGFKVVKTPNFPKEWSLGEAVKIDISKGQAKKQDKLLKIGTICPDYKFYLYNNKEGNFAIFAL